MGMNTPAQLSGDSSGTNDNLFCVTFDDVNVRMANTNINNSDVHSGAEQGQVLLDHDDLVLQQAALEQIDQCLALAISANKYTVVKATNSEKLQTHTRTDSTLKASGQHHDEMTALCSAPVGRCVRAFACLRVSSVCACVYVCSFVWDE